MLLLLETINNIITDYPSLTIVNIMVLHTIIVNAIAMIPLLVMTNHFHY